jgi:hypothetical protein
VKQRLEREYNAGKHTYFHQLNNSEVLVVVDSARSEGVRLYNQILNLTISNATLTLISLNAFFGLMVRFSTVIIGIF